MRILLFSLTAALTIMPGFAQKYEFGIAGGGSFYQSKSLTGSRGSADAGFDPGFAFSANIGNNMYERIGGELRYTFLKNDLKLSSGGTNVTFGSQAHAIHYDLLLHTSPMESKVRPYVAVGAGIKYFRGTGSEVLAQPLGNIALLTKANEVKGLVSVGGGVKVRVASRVLLRLDVHDYLTPFPDKVITPAAGVSAPGGWFNNIVFTLGVTLTD